MYLKLNNGFIEKYPYSIGELRKENPNVSFPKNISAEICATFNVHEVIAVTAPQSTYTNNVSESQPQLIDGNWTQVWNVSDKPIEDVNAIYEELRVKAYREESDPLFFKAQRGEIEQQVWLDKVEEIKTRFPE